MALDEELQQILASLKREKRRGDNNKSKKQHQDRRQDASKKKTKAAKAKAAHENAEREATRAQAEAIAAREEVSMLLEELHVSKKEDVSVMKSKEQLQIEKKKTASRGNSPADQKDHHQFLGSTIGELKLQKDGTLVSELTSQIHDNGDESTCVTSPTFATDESEIGFKCDTTKGLNLKCGDGGFEETIRELLCWFMVDDGNDPNDDDSAYRHRLGDRSLVM